MTGRRRRGAFLLVALCVTACAPEEAGTPPPAVTSTAERGPVSMTVRAEPGEVTAGGKLTLTVEATAPSGVEITMPEVRNALGPFAVRGARTPPDVPEGDRRRTVHVYTLDTFATGDQEVPALALRFSDRRAPGEPIEGTLESQALAVRVRSVLGGNEQARDIRGAVALPGGGVLRHWWIWLLILLGTAAAALAVMRVLGRRQAGAPAAAPEPPAHEWALAELDRLEREGLLERGEFEPFYTRLSDIVRQYIERRFGLMAPERTTQEFLVEARRSDALSEGHKTLLEGFLRAADLVKFARHQPRPQDAREALGAARGFVQETAPRVVEAAA